MIISFWKDNDEEEFMGINFLVSESEEEALAMIQVLADSDNESYPYTLIEGKAWMMTNANPEDPHEEHYVFECINKPNRGGEILPSGKEV